MILTQIPMTDKDLIPDRAIQDIMDAMEHGHNERTLKQIIDSIEDGSSQIWIKFSDAMAHECTVVTEIQDFPNCRSCIVNYLGGDNALGHMADVGAIEEWAKFNGCSDMRLIGRKGWERVMKTHGYENQYTIMLKELV